MATTKRMQKFNRLFNHYKLLALNRYRWSNLPDGIESRHIEEFLFGHGQAFFYDNKDLGLSCFKCSDAGNLNPYGDPVKVSIATLNGITDIVDYDKGVRILNNDVGLADIYTIMQYVENLVDAEIAMEANIRQQKFPFIVATTPETNKSMKTIMAKIFDEDELAVYVDKGLAAGEELWIKILPAIAPYVADKIIEYRKEIERELLTLLGINNSPIDKKERMITSEADANNSEINLNLDLGYKSRKEAVDKINKMFDLKIQVEKVMEEIGDYINDVPSLKEGGNDNE